MGFKALKKVGTVIVLLLLSSSLFSQLRVTEAAAVGCDISFIWLEDDKPFLPRPNLVQVITQNIN